MRARFDDYTATISMSGVPPDVKAMALFNRALILAADGENLSAIADLNVVLAIAETQTKSEPRRRKLVRMDRNSSQTNGETHPATSQAKD